MLVEKTQCLGTTLYPEYYQILKSIVFSHQFSNEKLLLDNKIV